MIDINELRQLAQVATPGPWLLRTVPTSAGLCHIISAADWRGAFIYGDGLRIGVDDSLPKAQELAANAHLIAAANPAVISELLNRLEAAEKDITIKEEVIDSLAAVVKRLDAQCDAAEAEALEQARLNGMGAEREAALLAKLEAAEKSDAESIVMYRKARDECAALRAKIAEMEKQEPAGYGVRYVEPTNGEEDWDSIWKYRVFAEDHIKDFTQAYVDIGEPVGAITVVPLYALPGAKGEEK